MDRLENITHRGMIVPQICIKCGDYIGTYPFDANKKVRCEHCNHNGYDFLEFYYYCQDLEDALNDSHFSVKLIRTAKNELNHGYMPDALAIISALLLGILTNTSYDLIKEWVLSKKGKYKKRYNLYQYEEAVEVLFEYLIDNENQIKEFEILDQDINIKFQKQLSDIKKEIEGKSN
uniref:Uncharacterized protein n=1 Tax=Candidatus Kentrum sp. LFY TaxID=2126342 RepID=A0A450W6M8_9GAMM|nr:MAG: hypothetical protein BECKLFY1418C_GA0070996_100161 [Candidatus Kentron sp. LFY]